MELVLLAPLPHGLVSTVTLGWEVVLLVMLPDELSCGTINGSIGNDGNVMIGYHGTNNMYYYILTW